MTETSTRPALATAQAFHQAWTSKNLDEAMTYIADDITVEAPGARIAGAEQYRGFVGQFLPAVTGAKMIAAFGDDTTAVLFYYLNTVPVSAALTAQCFTVKDGKITGILLVFDPTPFAPPQG